MAIAYSIIIPAFNEEDYLPKTLTCLQEAMDAVFLTGEIIVVDNNSTDKTSEIAEGYGARVVFEKINQISRARNAGAKQAHGRYLIFLDADTTVSSDLLRLALDQLQSEKYCAGGVLVNSDVPLDRLPRLALDSWNWLSQKCHLAAGCFIYCRHDAFADVGGFSEKVYASEEIWLSRKLYLWGRKNDMGFRIITEFPVTTSMRKLDWYSPLQLMLLSLPILVIPFAAYIRPLCSPWYRRPRKNK